MKRYGVVVVAAALLLAVGACYSARWESPESRIQNPDGKMDSARGLSITGYIDTAGTYHPLEGHVRALPGDSLEFHRPSKSAWRLERPQPEQRIVVHRSSVTSLAVIQISPVGTFLAVIGTTLIVGLVAVGIALATKESCPFIYSFDGAQFVFDGEPYGGATMKGLERTDWSALEHLVAVDGAYRLLLTNEVDETQHTNRLTLLVVDHAPGSTVVMDTQGHPHAFRRLEPLSAARDENGGDLLPWLRNTDLAAWSPDLERAVRDDAPATTRNHITLTFPRPSGGDHVYLVSNAGTGLWGSHMIRTMLGFRGSRINEFYAAINGSDVYRSQLLDWNAREELYELFPEVRWGDRWVRQEMIPGAGPFITESRAIPLDLSGVKGSRVEIRLNPPIGFWNLNSFHLAWDEDSLHVTRLASRTATDQEGANLAALLAEDDDDYLDFPTRAHQAELVFDAPAPAPMLERHVFAETRGWYEIHLHGLGDPDAAALERLTNEPGYAVKRLLQEFAEYRRSGRLAGVAVDSVGVEAR